MKRSKKKAELKQALLQAHSGQHVELIFPTDADAQREKNRFYSFLSRNRHSSRMDAQLEELFNSCTIGQEGNLLTITRRDGLRGDAIWAQVATPWPAKAHQTHTKAHASQEKLLQMCQTESDSRAAIAESENPYLKGV